MRTFLLVLRLAFWLNPWQRVLTCIGIVLMVADSIGLLPYSSPHPLFPVSLTGLTLASAASMLVGGVYWRMASAPRIVRLAPHGRTYLLGSVLGMVLLVALVWTVDYWLFFLRWVEPKFHLSVADNLTGMAGDAALLSTVAVGLFIASRSPLAALMVLMALLSPGVVAALFDVDLARRVRPAPGALAVLVLIWIPFFIWYLRARRISPPGWLATGGHDVLATVLVSSAAPRSRSEALQRQLLGGTTIIRFGAQWFAILGFLLALQWLLAKIGENDAGLSARVMYASLCICPIVTTIASFAAIRRTRSLWLLAGSTRGEFYACVERVLVRLNIVMALVFAVWLGALWLAHPWRPADATGQAALVYIVAWGLWLPGWFAIYAQLSGWPRWPVAMLAAATPFVFWAATAAGNSANEATRGMVASLFFITVMVATVALRWQAQRRWRERDFPRAATSTASGT